MCMFWDSIRESLKEMEEDWKPNFKVIQIWTFWDFIMALRMAKKLEQKSGNIFKTRALLKLTSTL